MCVRGNRRGSGDDNQTPNEANKVSTLYTQRLENIRNKTLGGD